MHIFIGILFRSPIDRTRIEATVMAASSVNFFSAFFLVSPARETIEINSSGADDWLISIVFSDLDPGLNGWWIVYECGNYANTVRSTFVLVYNKFFASYTRTNALDYSCSIAIRERTISTRFWTDPSV